MQALTATSGLFLFMATFLTARRSAAVVLLTAPLQLYCCGNTLSKIKV
jgi:hypothetical protein